jgi:CHAT domain-containing protein/tetratricopeptide (TPR) repeat protein
MGIHLVLAGLLVFGMADRSGQDARVEGHRAQIEIDNGRARQAISLYQLAYRMAAHSSDGNLRLSLLNNIAASQLTLFRYRDAEQTLLEARRAAQAAHNDAVLGSVDGNLAAMYAHLDDLPAAEMHAREAIKACSRTRQTWELQKVLLTLGDILSHRNLFDEGERYFIFGIRVASALHDRGYEVSAWTYYGMALSENGRLDDASRAFEMSRSLARASHRSDDVLWWNLSQLRLRQHDFEGALESINAAIGTSQDEWPVPLWRLYQTRAEVQLQTGHAAQALDDARKALTLARLLRANVIPDNDARVGSEGVLDAVYSVLIDAGNEMYLKTRDSRLLRETFEWTEENRADSLEKLLPTASDWRNRLPSPQYWDKLSELTLAQRRAVRVHSTRSSERVIRLQTELSEMEAAAKATVQARGDTILGLVEKRLPAGASLLSFRLGERAGWRWSVHQGKLDLCRLPAKMQLAAEIGEFESGIRRNDSGTIAAAGSRLYRNLFGHLAKPVAQSEQWFISADEPLYTVPMAALVMNEKGPVYLTERKTLLVVPGAQMLQGPEHSSMANQRFLAAGDGIYNHADPRYGGSDLLHLASWSMPRLPASGAEVRFAANFWRNPVMLTGKELSRRGLLREIERDPDVIHIASHVIPGQDRWRAGILALGIDDSGDPELLTPQEILLHPIHSRLVVMTGCASASGDALPASGLMGLTRAWLAAGAGEVLATRWPVKDEDQAGLIGSFYRHLLKSRGGTIPEALQRAREDMIARGGWRAEPRYWSSFFLIGVR